MNARDIEMAYEHGKTQRNGYEFILNSCDRDDQKVQKEKDRLNKCFTKAFHHFVKAGKLEDLRALIQTHRTWFDVTQNSIHAMLDNAVDSAIKDKNYIAMGTILQLHLEFVKDDHYFKASDAYFTKIHGKILNHYIHANKPKDEIAAIVMLNDTADNQLLRNLFAPNEFLHKLEGIKKIADSEQKQIPHEYNRFMAFYNKVKEPATLNNPQLLFIAIRDYLKDPKAGGYGKFKSGVYKNTDVPAIKRLLVLEFINERGPSVRSPEDMLNWQTRILGITEGWACSSNWKNTTSNANAYSGTLFPPAATHTAATAVSTNTAASPPTQASSNPHLDNKHKHS